LVKELAHAWFVKVVFRAGVCCLVELSVGVDSIVDDCKSALGHACEHGHISNVKRLLDPDVKFVSREGGR
jgi:hypothetical protein